MYNNLYNLIDKLKNEQMLKKDEFVTLIENRAKCADYLYKTAAAVRDKYYSNDIYIRGLIEFTNYCKNDCFYCGIRKSNKNIHRYRLTKEDILNCCDTGYKLGFRTFVLQGGEDLYYTDEIMVDIISSIKKSYPDCAVTLSIGEKSHESYKAYFDAGADRYLLRHETANFEHYSKLHPNTLTAKSRRDCLFDLKKIGYQVGAGFMVGSPYQSYENLAEDLIFLKELNPQMVGIGPFIPQHDTPFANEKAGTLDLTLFMLALTRLILPKVLLPSTTALGTIAQNGRELGIKAGANVVMPNLSPKENRKDYMLYDNKICTGDESAQCIVCMKNKMESIGHRIVVDKGDSKNI